MKLKILNIAELYPPGYAGGAAMYVHDTCQFLAERGHDVRVLCTESNSNPPYSIREEIIEDVKLYRLNLPYFRDQDPGGWMLSIKEWKAHCVNTIKSLEKILVDWQPDLVQFHTPYSLIEECLPVFLERKIPIVGMAHDFWTICLRLGLSQSPTDSICSGPSVLKCLECNYSYWDKTHLKALLKLPIRMGKLGFYPAYRLRSRKNLQRYIDGLICVSKHMADAHQGKIKGEVRHISLGIDLTNLPNSSVERPRSPIRFGFVAGFVDYKGIWDVLDTIVSLKKNQYKFEVHIWGPKQDEALLIERNIEDVVFLRGLYSPSEIWKAYEEMDILLMPSRWNEPYGRIIQEAAAAKLPSIATRIGGITEQIRDGVDGLLFNYRDREDLEKQMIKVIENPDLIKKFISNLWNVINTKDAVQQMEDFYLEILSKRTND